MQKLADKEIEEVAKKACGALKTSMSSILPDGVKITDEGWREILFLLREKIGEACAEEDRKWKRATENNC